MMAADAVRCMRRSGGSGGGAHKYWRVHATRTMRTSPIYIQLAEVEFRIAGISQSVGGTAIGSTYYASYRYHLAFDGSATTVWNSSSDSVAGQMPQWIGYTHATPVAIDEVAIRAGYVSGSSAPLDFTVEYSDDGIDWTVALEVVSEPAWGKSELRTYTL